MKQTVQYVKCNVHESRHFKSHNILMANLPTKKVKYIYLFEDNSAQLQ